MDQKKNWNEDFLITLGGPIQTILTGTIGFLLLLQQRKKISNANSLTFFQWLSVFMSLFWVRQFVNLAIWIFGYFKNGFFFVTNDEVILAVSLGSPKGIFLIFTSAIALPILLFIFFKIIPKDMQGVFFLAGIIGCLSGYIVWFKVIGPRIMP